MLSAILGLAAPVCLQHWVLQVTAAASAMGSGLGAFRGQKR